MKKDKKRGDLGVDLFGLEPLMQACIGFIELQYTLSHSSFKLAI